MKCRMVIFPVAILALSATMLNAQQVGRSDIMRTGENEVISTNAKDTADKKVADELVQTLLIDDFESAGEWSAFIPRDYGVCTAIRREGGPRELESIKDRNKYVLGVKVEFMRRDWSWLSVVPAKPTRIKGITKSLSVWVVGRNYKHTLSMVLKDYLDRPKYLKAERMIWVGWKLVTVNLPDTIEQENYKISEDRGITFMGFRIDFEPDDILGRPFYVYFDYLTADTDLFSEKNQNPDDMMDNW